MSVAAMAWAFRQTLPPKPKIVLLALADQTDETTGRVCYGKTDIKHIAQKCSVGERSLYRYLAALIRNGYALRESGASRGTESQFWLCLDRPVAKPGDWQWSASDDAGDGDEAATEPAPVADSSEGGSANLAEGQNVENSVIPDQNGRPPLPQDGRPRLSGRPGNIHTRTSAREASGFSRKQQAAEIEALSIKKKAASENVTVFVIQGTRAWAAWIEYRRRKGMVPSMPTCNGVGVHALKRGWWLPTLFPPDSRADPPVEMSNSDHDALADI